MFSFGNIILSTLTHEWPNPGPPTRYEGNTFVAITELQRRERYVIMFTAQEKQLFLPTVNQCLENRPDKRPSSVMLVRELRRIESSLPTGSHVASPIELLRQQLSVKEEECRQKDEALRVKDEVIAGKDVVIGEKEAELQRLRNARRKSNETAPGMGKQLAATQKVNVVNGKMLAHTVEVYRKHCTACIDGICKGKASAPSKAAELTAVHVLLILGNN